ncbi:hypothetical protein DY000_02020432 [Brassica cretica]|uniref:Uncharacterized protein n=1 Tax=Brassica cretica TaxID=69181 RepID=A0ABQ7ELC9_BRACR|nr:hypothetical protein DY000_02020432 [Brassica cretica]
MVVMRSELKLEIPSGFLVKAVLAKKFKKVTAVLILWVIVKFWSLIEISKQILLLKANDVNGGNRFASYLSALPYHKCLYLLAVVFFNVSERHGGCGVLVFVTLYRDGKRRISPSCPSSYESAFYHSSENPPQLDENFSRPVKEFVSLCFTKVPAEEDDKAEVLEDEMVMKEHEVEKN